MALTSASDFYHDTLARSGLAPAAKPPAEKTAADLGVSVEVVKLASTYFEQLQLDGIAYPTLEDCRDDALKLAKKYVAHRDAEVTKAAALADAAMVSALRAAAALIAEQKIAHLTPAEIVRMAVLQLDAMDDATKCAAWSAARAPATQALLATTEASKVASVVPELAAWAGRDPLAIPGAGAMALLEN